MNTYKKIGFGNYPFYVGVRESQAFNEIPADLPFNIYIDPESVLPTLDITKGIESALDLAYGQGSMLSTPLGIGRLGFNRMEEFVEQFVSYFGDPSGKKIIEIGCGEGHLLARLKEMGADVMGLEIGPQGKNATEAYGISIIDKPLEQVSLDVSFDAIISYGCLEHILDIKSFINHCRTLLNKNGVMFHSVPNTENTIENFRFDDLCHQHVNYFSPENANRFFQLNGFGNVSCQLTKAGNEMYMMARSVSETDNVAPVTASEVQKAERDWQDFSSRLDSLKENFKKNLHELLNSGSVGFYAGGHILTQMTGMGDTVRYYDSDSVKHGQSWLAGLPTIASPLSLVKEPVAHLVIAPEHHMPSISTYLKSEVGIPDSIQLKRISDLYV